MVKVTENLRMLAAEASAAQHLIVDAGAIDVLLYELRRKFPRVVVDLPRGATPVQRVVLAAASRVVVLCERSLAGLRDTIRMQTLLREQAPQARLSGWSRPAPAASSATVGKSEFEKGIGKSLRLAAFVRPESGRRGGECGSAAAGGGAAQPGCARVAATRRTRRRSGGSGTKRRFFAIRSPW